MSDLVADTHAALWYLHNTPALSSTASAAMDATILAGGSVFVASVTLVEVTYLIEKGRLPAFAFDILTGALTDPASGLVLAVLDLPVAHALRTVRRNLVPDMPDRIITATAVAMRLPLVTADRQIRASGVTTIW